MRLGDGCRSHLPLRGSSGIAPDSLFGDARPMFPMNTAGRTSARQGSSRPRRLSTTSARLEQGRGVRLHAAEGVVVEGDAVDAAGGGQGPGLLGEGLGGEDAPDGAEGGAEALQVPAELLQAVDLAAALDLDGDVGALVVAAQQVDRADVGRVLA